MKVTYNEYLKRLKSDYTNKVKVVSDVNVLDISPPQSICASCYADVPSRKRAKIENGKIGEFDFFWIEE